MPICVDDRATNGVPFTFIYSAIFMRLRLRLPFTFFEKDLLTELNVAPCQLHPNAWAFIQAFEILCNHFRHPPSTNVFLHFFEAKNPGDRSWVSLNGVSGRVILGLYQQSFKDWKGRFYMITSNEHSPTLLEGFPLYWVPKVEFRKPRGLEAMAPYERELCGLLSSLGAKFGSSTLIKHEFDAEMLKKYIGLLSLLSFNLLFIWACILALACHTCTFAYVNYFSALVRFLDSLCINPLPCLTDADMTSNKERRQKLITLAKSRRAVGSSSRTEATAEPIPASPISVAPAEGPETRGDKKRKQLVKAPTTVVSIKEESSGSPLVQRRRRGAKGDEGGASPTPPAQVSPARPPSPAPIPSPAPVSSPPPASQPLTRLSQTAGSGAARSEGTSHPSSSPCPQASAATT